MAVLAAVRLGIQQVLVAAHQDKATLVGTTQQGQVAPKVVAQVAVQVL